MDQALYIKLTRQIARQTPELAALDADIAARTPAVQALKATLDAAQTALDAATAAQAGLSQQQAAAEAALADATHRAETSGEDAEAIAQAITDRNAAQAALDALAPQIAAAKTAIEAAQAALQSAQQAHAGPRAELDDVTRRADAIRSAIAQCQTALDASGVTMTAQEIESFDLAQARAQVWERIKRHRDAAKGLGVLVGDKWFNSDADSRIQQLGLVMMGANVPPVSWKTMDGSFVTMTPTLAGQIFQATATRDMAVFAVAEQHRVAVNASAAPDAYDCSTGWPAGFQG